MLKSAGMYLLVLALSSAVWLPAQSPLVSAELPQLKTSEFPPETQKQVEQAFAAAHEHLNDAEAVGKLGMLLDLYHRPDDAALCYRRAHLLVPTAFKWLYYLGSLLFNQKKLQDAVPVLTAALNLQPRYLPAKLKLGEALLETGGIEAAAEIYEGILKDHPDTAEAYYGLGRVQSARGDQSSAADKYRKACDLFPSYGAAHYGLALAYHKLGRLSDAKEQLELRNRGPNIVPPVADLLRDELRDLDQSAMDHLERGMLLELQQEMQKLTAAHQETSERVAKIEARRSAAAASERGEEALLLALGQLRGQVQGSQPFAAELGAVEALGRHRPEVHDNLAPLTASAATGIPSFATLRQRFDREVVPALMRAAPPQDDGWGAQIMSRLRSLVVVRRVGGNAADTTDPVEGAVARAETALASSDLAGAVNAVEALPAAKAKPVQSWLADANQRLAAEQGLARLTDQLTAQLAAEDRAANNGAAPRSGEH